MNIPRHSKAEKKNLIQSDIYKEELLSGCLQFLWSFNHQPLIGSCAASAACVSVCVREAHQIDHNVIGQVRLLSSSLQET